ncbi:hypothetical protein [Synechococcus sp. CC9616]|jgi:hypothetical protein|uniref:hypothetical protein n=1 Tax=Synechococcus sp. CC9616 TaxID=110663 RepID=UPI0004AEEF6D|nr:hypothetical protein [Synechococcus sp. CC9616]
MEWNGATVSLLTTGVVFLALQIWWIGSLLQRNRRRRGAAPLSSRDFRRELDRIFRDSP